MENKLNGIHHITAIAGDPQKNYDFYVKVLGLRLVKKTINFDAPDVYHLYFGDEIGSPGTIITFFPFPGARRGKLGAGEISTVSYSVPKNSLDFWIDRLISFDINFDGPSEKLDHKYISFLDSEGMKIELVEDDVDHLPGWEYDDIGKDKAIKKFFGAAFYLYESQETEKLLTEYLGFQKIHDEQNFLRFQIGENDSVAYIDIHTNPNANLGISSAGTVHHIAWRTKDTASQIGWFNKLDAAGYHPTEIKDRNYFQSIYFREPGGILFEIATDEPGFLIDEDIDSLGSALKLPEWYEARRNWIESKLIPLEQIKNANKAELKAK